MAGIVGWWGDLDSVSERVPSEPGGIAALRCPGTPPEPEIVPGSIGGTEEYVAAMMTAAGKIRVSWKGGWGPLLALPWSGMSKWREQD